MSVEFDAKVSVTQGLDHLAERLNPIIRRKLSADLGIHPWTVVLQQLDDIAGKPPRVYSPTDLQAQLKMFTRRLGNMGFPFDDSRQTVGTLGRELTIVRNARAHGDDFSKLDAWRAHDYCVRLLEYFSDGAGLVRANELRQAALVAFVEAEGIAPVPVAPVPDDSTTDLNEPNAAADVGEPGEPVIPDPSVYKRPEVIEPGLVGAGRLPFEPWQPVLVGDVSVLDDLPKMAAKQKVRAVASEIVEAEGPIHLDRLSQLVAASFGLRKLHSSRAVKIGRQVRASGLVVDKAKFVWPEGVLADHWTEFRPNTSGVDRPFTHVSPVEIANAMRFLRAAGTHEDEDIDTATLRTFGRRRRTKQCETHMNKARQLL